VAASEKGVEAKDVSRCQCRYGRERDLRKFKRPLHRDARRSGVHWPRRSGDEKSITVSKLFLLAMCGRLRNRRAWVGTGV